MPTAKPRLQVTLTTPQYQLLKRLAELQGTSMSKIVAELFDQVHPVLERVAVVLQAAVRAQVSMKDGLRESTEQAERELRPLVAQALGQLDLLQMDYEAASAPEGASAASPVARMSPPLSNTGGRTTKTSKQASGRRILRRGNIGQKARPLPLKTTVLKHSKGGRAR